MPKLLRILAECFNLQKSPSHFSLAIFSYKPKRAAVYKNTTTFSQPSFSTMYSCYLFPYEVFKYNLKFLFFITLPVILTYLLFSQILNLLLPAYGILKIGFLSTGCYGLLPCDFLIHHLFFSFNFSLKKIISSSIFFPPRHNTAATNSNTIMTIIIIIGQMKISIYFLSILPQKMHVQIHTQKNVISKIILILNFIFVENDLYS